ncbi:MAG: hypothetical protein KatS3mg115_1592 [Candidatus Poribacteria bacterium]|nr:MAG: hypothetical protein KatS3mg115_1592 [Candidatus Poribacteria bacterium]
MIDDQIGRLLDELDGQKVLNDTLIVYTSDHGHMNGHHGLHTKGNATVPQNFIEESIRVPCLLSWVNGIEGGQVRSEPVDHIDLFQTLLDAARVDLPAELREEIRSPGASYLPLLQGREIPWRGYQICEYGNARMIRTETAKLIRRYPGPNGHFPDEFYDLVEDPRENENRIEDPRYRDRIEELSEQLEAFFQRYEFPEASGKEIERQPSCNPNEPWRVEV